MTMIVKILLLLLGLSCCVLGRSLKYGCPPQESLLLCKCDANALEVDCFKIGDENNLNDTLYQLKGYYFKNVELSDVNAKSLPMDLFEGLHIQRLKLKNFEVKDGYFDCENDYQPLKGLETSLESLEIERSFRILRPIKCLKLNHMKMFSRIFIVDSNIPEIGNDWSINLPESFSTQFLIGNGIGALADEAFQPLENLVILVVRGNNISKISRSMLPNPAKHLISLDFKDNKISEIPNDIFSNMPSLKEVNFANNFFCTLQSDTWANILPQLYKIYLPGNYFLCDDKMKWICEYKTEFLIGECFLPVDYKGLTISQFCKH